ncbi:MAG: hypothetical protein SGBAC_001718 [Bacillariaceae sp.]
MAKPFGTSTQPTTKRGDEKVLKNGGDGDKKSNAPSNNTISQRVTMATVIPQLLPKVVLKYFCGVTMGLYILNQKHLLPRPISAIVSRSLFWPTLPITVSRRVGKWITRVDDTVLIGGAPFDFAKIPETLYNDHNVRGVINMCEEYKGPLRKYKELGIEELHLPTTDHFEPELEDLMSAIAFIRRHEAQGKCVYVHCRAGHGRSAAAVFGWLIYKDPIVDLQALNSEFRKMRNVRSTLWKQSSIQQLHQRLKETGSLMTMDDMPSSDVPPPKLIDGSDSDEDL